VVAADRDINDQVVGAIKTKVHKFDITLLVAGGRRRRHLVVDAHRVACVIFWVLTKWNGAKKDPLLYDGWAQESVE